MFLRPPLARRIVVDMHMQRLHELLPDAPQWFWVCTKCSGDAVLHGHIEFWLERCKRKELDGTLWSYAGPFFDHFHHNLDHHKYGPYAEGYEETGRDHTVQARRARIAKAIEPITNDAKRWHYEIPKL